MRVKCPVCGAAYDLEPGKYQCECGVKFYVDVQGNASTEAPPVWSSEKTMAPRRHVDSVTVDERTVPPRKHREEEPDDDRTMPGIRERKTDGRFEPGDLIMGRYKVIAELGQGGMGIVYKCFDETAGVEIALKALPPELSHNTLEMEDIKENFQLIHNLHHPNIASSNNLERDNSNGDYYLIMECVEGEDLRRWIKRKRREGGLKLEDVLPVIRQVAEALDYAHEQKIIHRDIKPGNIMIDSEGHVKVLDFGLAAQIHTSMTRVSMAYHGTSGTGPYMSPEQWRGRAQGAAADQYALAVMTYEMLAGHLPFESSDPTVLREAVLNETVPWIPGVPAGVQWMLSRALNKDAASRFGSCLEFVNALQYNEDDSEPVKRSFPFKKILLLLIFLCIFDGLAYILYNYWMETNKQEETAAQRAAAEEAARKAQTVEEARRRAAAQAQAAEEARRRAAEKARQAEEARRRAATREQAETEARSRNNESVPSQPAWGGQTATLHLPNNVSLELVKIKAGTFMMGSPEGELGRQNDEQQHRVTLTRDYWLGKYEVTQGQWKAVMGYNPSSHKNGDNFPVEQVSWHDARNFCNKLNGLYVGKLPAGYRFDLPTEAQWEYACRAGTTTALNNGKNLTSTEGRCPNLDKVGWYAYRGQKYFCCTRAVGTKHPNAWGLFDMHGNVWEWCRDWYGSYGGDETDPTGPVTGSKRVIRGCGCGYYAWRCRSAARCSLNPGEPYHDRGFRLALVPVDSSMQGGQTTMQNSPQPKQTHTLPSEGHVFYSKEARQITQFDMKKAHSFEQLLYQAKDNFRKAENLYDNRAKLSNLRDAIILYRSVVKFHEQFTPKPKMWDQAKKKLDVALRERDAKMRLLDAEFNRLSQKNDFAAMRQVFLNQMELSEPESREYARAKNRLVIIDQALRKKQLDSSMQKPQTTVHNDSGSGQRIFQEGDSRFTVNLPGGKTLEMVKIKAGTFMMSAKDGENANNENPHWARLTHDFYIGKTEVTQEQWRAVMGRRPLRFDGDNRPVRGIAWIEAMDFCTKLNQAGKAPQGWKFTLPTETQWEYSARGGNRSRGYKYSGSNIASEVSWHNRNSGGRSHPVAMKKPNELGLYDMSGNVWEWCLDDYKADSRQAVAEFSRENDRADTPRVIRGGHWGDDAWSGRSAHRHRMGSHSRYYNLGFRLALVPIE